jgi:hemolysin activation/secretion protein
MINPYSRLLIGTALAALTFSAFAADGKDNSVSRFEIVRFEVEGNTLLDAKKVQQLLTPYAGANRDFGDVQRALEALEAAYRRQGFNVVQVVLPEQELNQGVVHLRVVEAHIGKVTIEGNKFFDNANVRRSLPMLREGATPNIDQISAGLRVANDNPAKKTNLQLKTGDNDGELDAALTVVDTKAWKVGANFDNAGTASTGKTHVGLLYENANITGHDDVITTQYTTSVDEPSKVKVYGVGYHLPLYEQGNSIDLFGSYSNVDSGTVSAGIFDLQVSGRGAVYGGRYNMNFARMGDYDSKLIAGLDYRAYKNSVQLLATQLGNDVTVHPVSLTYAGTWNMTGGTANIYFTGMHNIPGGDQGAAADFNRARTGASDTYNILRYGIGLSRALPADWQMRVNLNGQYTNDALVPGEQFGAGGASSVRGFTERAQSNDSGRLATAELYTPNLCSNGTGVAIQCRMLAFYDTAYLSRNRPLPGEPKHGSIGSVGLGLRFALDTYATLQMDYGYIVDAGDIEARGDKRLHFMLALSY